MLSYKFYLHNHPFTITLEIQTQMTVIINICHSVVHIPKANWRVIIFRLVNKTDSVLLGLNLIAQFCDQLWGGSGSPTAH